MVARILIGFCLFLLFAFPAIAAEDPRKRFEMQVEQLGDVQPAVRDSAAAAIRDLVKQSGAVPGAHDEGYWKKALAAIRLGMTKAEVDKILPCKGETQPSLAQGMGSVSEKRRLDDEWEATLYFDANGVVNAEPKLRRSVESIWIPPAETFSGKWVTYFVNGQKATEIEYKNGEYNGTYTSFYSNGRKSYEQHYVDGVVQGPDQGWHENGQQSYTGQYVNDRQDGVWIWWNPDGTKQKEVLYKMGKAVSETKARP